MSDQPYVVVPSLPGNPNPTEIATDDLSGVGVGPFRQQMTLADISAQLHACLQMLSVLGPAQDPTTGRLRIVLDAITSALTLGKINTIGGFGGIGNVAQPFISDATYLPVDITVQAWSLAVRQRVT